MRGGLQAAARVNLLELAVLVLGFALALPLAWDAAGGAAALTALQPSADYWHFWQGGSSGWGYLPLLVPAFLISPGLLQKIYGARDERSVRRGVGWSGLALLAFAAVPTLLGILARQLHGELESPELALPILLTSDLPLAVGMLGLAAVFSAEISSADAILFMLATSLSQDLYRRYLVPDATDAQVLRVARRAALLGGLLGIGLAMLLPSVISSLKIFYSLLGVSLFVPILAGIHLDRRRRSEVPEALAAIGVGVVVLILRRQLGGIWSPKAIGRVVKISPGPAAASSP